MKFAQWLGKEAFIASALDPEAPLDDLEPLRALVGEARVVAIGENAHHAREFYLLRHRLLRFLVERCGFIWYAFEAPRMESEPVDSWVRGASGDLAELTGTPAMALAHHKEMHDALGWMRARNAAADRPVGFSGVAASVVPELLRVRAHLRRTDPGTLPLLERALTAAYAYHDEHPMRELFNYGALEQSTRDRLSADLSRLLGRMEATTDRGDDALACARGAWQADHLYRDFSGHGLPVGTTALDTSMAETVLRLLDEDPDAKVVLALHNVHLRATPVEHDEPADILPAGYHLRAALGRDYVAIAATGNRGSVACGELNSGEPSGMDLVQRPLPPPEPGSIEAAFAEAAIDDSPLAIADLRAAKVEDAGSFTKFRSQDEFLDAPIFEAFDAVACVPHLRPAGGLR
ncbi:erythromycin esterase family protein [Saccharomonospora sp. NPDC006951]